ncbi:MAG: hypothetical protein ACYTXY_07605 [Nostoc sp.]
MGWASRHWCQVKADAQMSSEVAALRRCRRRTALTKHLRFLCIRDFQEINYPSCGVGILPALNMGRVGTPIPLENLGCFFISQSLIR